MKSEKPISVRDIIDHDMAVKCGQDVGEVMRRNFLLLDTKRAVSMAAISGASTAMATLAGAFWAGTERPLDASALDDLWTQVIRPLSLSVLGDRGPFLAMLAEIEKKADQ